ncbi:hypothetical protein CRG98_023930 [Punica granatum]|uniref:Vps16 N-terminal domain-containing protein n=1 Tax=Punica granatum TaxID=22663 RepID=A0A2I0JHI6_PUNGR|nr:hypothetical protein CRG98_023930 [Punica granatum]
MSPVRGQLLRDRCLKARDNVYVKNDHTLHVRTVIINEVEPPKYAQVPTSSIGRCIRSNKRRRNKNLHCDCERRKFFPFLFPPNEIGILSSGFLLRRRFELIGSLVEARRRINFDYFHELTSAGRDLGTGGASASARMANVSVAVEWQLLYNRYYRKPEPYPMRWKHIDLSRNKVACAPFGGQIAVIRDDSKIVCDPEVGIPLSIKQYKVVEAFLGFTFITFIAR